MKSERAPAVARAVILAGGRGTRLAPYTTVLPKPLMPVGEMPILEILIRRLKSQGLDRITLCVGHLASLIQAYFGDGTRFGVEIVYSVEDGALGTAGPLALVQDLSETFLVMNGDLLTDLDFSAFVDAHRRAGAAVTVGLYQRDVRIDLGVIEADAGDRVTAYVEKPVYRYRASMGVYAMEPGVLARVPKKQAFDLPDLIRALLANGDHVLAYQHMGYWLDIGRPEDYEQAQADFPGIKERLLGQLSE